MVDGNQNSNCNGCKGKHLKVLLIHNFLDIQMKRYSVFPVFMGFVYFLECKHISLWMLPLWCSSVIHVHVCRHETEKYEARQSALWKNRSNDLFILTQFNNLLLKCLHLLSQRCENVRILSKLGIKWGNLDGCLMVGQLSTYAIKDF